MGAIVLFGGFTHYTLVLSRLPGALHTKFFLCQPQKRADTIGIIVP